MKKLEKYSKYNTLILRISVGVLFFFSHGLSKLNGGPEMWAKVGGAMGVVGITFLPAFWGFLAAYAESIGALMIAAGFFTRIHAALLGFTMLIATIGAHGSDLIKLNWGGFELPLLYLVISVTLLFSGAGEVCNTEKKIFGKEF